MKRFLFSSFILIFFFSILNYTNSAQSEEIYAYCLIKNSDLKQAKVGEEDYARFQGKVITFLISFDEDLIVDVSDDGEVSVITGMYGPTDMQSFKKTSNGINYTNKIEVVGETEDQRFTYKYNNKLTIVNGKPKLLQAVVDQTGFSMNSWRFLIDCRDTEYTSEEIKIAKNDQPKKPKNFEELMEKIEKNRDRVITKIKTYSLFIEEDYDTVLLLELMAKSANVFIISYGGFEFFEKVYNQKDNEGYTFIQPSNLKKQDDMMSYMNEGYEINNFEWNFIFRNDDQIITSNSLEFTNAIKKYRGANQEFSISTLKPDVAWYAGTFDLVNNTDDLIRIYKKNKQTYCSILNEEIIITGKNLELAYLNPDFRNFNKKNNINCN